MNRLKLKWHDTTEATYDQANDTIGFEDTNEGSIQDFQDEFQQRITIDDLDQTSQSRRGKLNRKAKNKAKNNLSSLKNHLLTTTGLLALAKASGMPIIDSGVNVFGLATEEPTFADPFNPENLCHVLETEITDVDLDNLSSKAYHNMTMMQNFDLFEDAKDYSFTPTSVIDHYRDFTVV